MYYIKFFFTCTTFSFLLISCDSGTEVNSADRPQEVAQEMVQSSTSNQKFDIVPNEKVCMVNDRFMGVDQIPVAVDGKTYYGCCENCVIKIKENINGVRFSKDPVSGEKVDKASAIIVQNKEGGGVFYFASMVSADEFIKRYTLRQSFNPPSPIALFIHARCTRK